MVSSCASKGDHERTKLFKQTMLLPKPTLAMMVKSAEAAQIGLELGRKKNSIVATLPMPANQIRSCFLVRAAAM